MSDREKAARGFFFTACALIGFFAVSMAFRLISGDGASGVYRTFILVWPASWQFYLTPDHDEFTVVYRIDERDGTFEQWTRPAGDPSYRLGLDHAANSDPLHMYATIAAIPADAWKTCRASAVSECEELVASAPRPAVPSRMSSLCGPAVFTTERPTEHGTGLEISRVAAVDLTCSR